MKEQSASGMLGTSIEKIKDLVDVSTIIGETIRISDSLQIIPVSKVTYGFASGGTDFPSKGSNELFGGGGGAGITITPVAFLVINNGGVTVRYINAAEGSVERVIGMVPDLVDKATDVIDKIKGGSGSSSVDTAINDYIAQNEQNEVK